ncbi:MAG: lipid IV(A) 3-deoxy-D-manno-octulosonic acid transferase [Sulfurovum sp.]|nr:lipid IV(A) 3-deoxy-D-manno-octulosonic acid transferase [Sulfurovum sp.]
MYIFSIPFLFILSFKKKYKDAIPARFFLKNNTSLSPDGIWFHVCSYGEAKAIKPLVDSLPPALLRMSTTTYTGVEVLSGYTQERRYLPFEPLLFTWMKPQKVLVVMEAEFWYLLFILAKRRGAKTLLVNARISEISYPKYLRMKWLYKQIFHHIDEVYAQTALDKTRLESLGAKDVRVTGNIKLSQIEGISEKLVKPLGFLVCAASTHEGEEKIILEAFSQLKKENIDAKLIVVPRHPERFDSVARMIEGFSNKENITWHRYTEQRHFDDDIVLVDVLGELVNIYAISELVILGGAFTPIGGHNAAEAAQFGCKIISGPYYFNQKDIFEAVEGIEIVESLDLSKKLLEYVHLKTTSIKSQTDLTPILESIKKEL